MLFEPVFCTIVRDVLAAELIGQRRVVWSYLVSVIADCVVAIIYYQVCLPGMSNSLLLGVCS